MRVYRVAKPVSGSRYFPGGPYAYVSEHDLETRMDLSEMTWSHDNSRTHPAPMREGHGKMMPSERCGFSSELQLLEWFDEYLDMLDSRGFEVYEYEVYEDWVYEYTYQVIFDERFAEFIRKYPINAKG